MDSSFVISSISGHIFKIFSVLQDHHLAVTSNMFSKNDSVSFFEVRTIKKPFNMLFVVKELPKMLFFAGTAKHEIKQKIFKFQD